MMNGTGLRAHHLLLIASMLGGALAACGGGAPQPQTPSTEKTSAVDAGAPPAVAEPAKPGAPAPTAPAPGGAAASTDIVPSKMIADIKAIGIDLASPGDLSKMDMSKKKKLMPFFVKALGMSGCDGCHVAGDFKAPRTTSRWLRRCGTTSSKIFAPRAAGRCFATRATKANRNSSIDPTRRRSRVHDRELQDKLAARRQEGSHLRDLPLRTVRGKDLRQAVEGRPLNGLWLRSRAVVASRERGTRIDRFV